MRLYHHLLAGAGISANAGVLAFLLGRPLVAAFFMGAFVVCALIAQAVDVSQAQEGGGMYVNPLAAIRRINNPTSRVVLDAVNHLKG